MIRVLVADDHAIVRKGLCQILAETCDIEVTGEAGQGREVLKKVARNPFDVVVLDISMPDISGLDILKQLHADYPRLPVLILSIHAEDQYAVRVLKAGAAGYLTKESAPAMLIQAIRKTASGGRFITPSVAERLADALEYNTECTPHEQLSDRELQVLTLMASGKTVSGIADRLCLSVKTISTYRARILEKMNMKNNAELTRYALEHGLVD